MTTKKPITSNSDSGSKATGIVVGLLIVAVVAIIIVAMAFGGGDDTASTEAADSARIPTSGTLRQVSFAEAAGTSLPRLDGVGSDPAIGMAAPTITASYFDNTEITIDFADGQPRVVLFMAHWCPHCQAEVTALVDRFATEGVRTDVELIAISTNVDQGAQNHPPSRWLTAEGWPIPTLRDSATNELATSFGLSGFPFLTVVNGDGEIVARQSGAVPQPQWNTFLDQALTASKTLDG